MARLSKIILSVVTLILTTTSAGATKVDYYTTDIQRGDKKLAVRQLEQAIPHFRKAVEQAQADGDDRYYKDSVYRITSAANSRLAFVKLHEGDVAAAGELYLETINQLRQDYEKHYEMVKFQEEVKHQGKGFAMRLLKGAVKDKLSDFRGAVNKVDKHNVLSTSDVFNKLGSSVDRMIKISPPEIWSNKQRMAGDVDKHQIRIAVIPDTDYLQHIGRVTDNATSSCTGSLVGPNLVLTNAHCLYNGGVDYGLGDTKLKKGKFYFRTEWLYELKEYKAKTFYTHQGKKGGWSGKVADDWAILVLENNRKNKLPGTYLKTLADLTIATEKNIFTKQTPADVFIAGYSGDLNSGAYLTMDWGCTLDRKKFGDDVVDHDCSTYKGSSGAPVVYLDENLRPTVVSLNVGKKGGNHEYAGLVVPPRNWYPRLNQLLN
ncbi:MAG: trypsin-like peptidase domain-containing protein [Arenicella sp.]|nr:trypsin-like peptidase domain-containing protein [Arenicella sp.]